MEWSCGIPWSMAARCGWSKPRPWALKCPRRWRKPWNSCVAWCGESHGDAMSEFRGWMMGIFGKSSQKSEFLDLVWEWWQFEPWSVDCHSPHQNWQNSMGIPSTLSEGPSVVGRKSSVGKCARKCYIDLLCLIVFYYIAAPKNGEKYCFYVSSCYIS